VDDTPSLESFSVGGDFHFFVDMLNPQLYIAISS